MNKIKQGIILGILIGVLCCGLVIASIAVFNPQVTSPINIIGGNNDTPKEVPISDTLNSQQDGNNEDVGGNISTTVTPQYKNIDPGASDPPRHTFIDKPRWLSEGVYGCDGLCDQCGKLPSDPGHYQGN